ncbi:PTS sugar transporter subunit IIA [Endomicrobium proavitum]|uniref:PTS mannose/fructose/N-acetylgalactosamine-specific component IIA n=1 Tax=Endomicrobium proavitum TaxID=1408281 RepID=A0A0G3WGM5_9BACT|nr:hypothetical protein [Endomicrobium proavitum]AKL97468.1 PTS mannose/fructose/N-acetylgalactosamine-specific component IIA [Endomicrobium proavitum]
MIKIVVATHGNFAQELINAAESIAGKQSNLYAVKRAANDSLAQMQQKIEELLKSVGGSQEDGALILADMLGGTPCNAAAPMCKIFNTELIAGVNLPILLSAIFASKSATSAAELACKVLQDGQKSIVNVKKMLTDRAK